MRTRVGGRIYDKAGARSLLRSIAKGEVFELPGPGYIVERNERGGLLYGGQAMTEDQAASALYRDRSYWSYAVENGSGRRYMREVKAS